MPTDKRVDYYIESCLESTSTESTATSTEESLLEYVPTCVPMTMSSCPLKASARNKSYIHFPNEQSASDSKHFGGIQPIHYNLNLTVHRSAHTLITGDISITLKVINQTSTIFVNVGRSLSELNASQIYVSDCSTGKLICVETVKQYVREELLLIRLGEDLMKNQIVVLKIISFKNPRAHDGVIVQTPQRWDSKRPWTVASFFQFRKARSIFPCIDVPTFKASMNLCITHPKNSNARSNTRIDVETERDDAIITCFERTPKMSTYLYAFATYDRLQSQIVEADAKSRLPELELLYSKQMNPDKPSWMRSEAAQALKYMEEYTNYTYPLNKLTLLATPLPVQGMENFGLILLNEKWVEYPMFAVAHTMLAHEIVHQWFGNVVTVNVWDELCLQEGLSSYIGYKVNEATTGATLSEAYNKIRELQEKRIRGIEKDTRSRMPIIGEFQTYEDALRCFDKPVLFFEMLNEGFGKDTVKKFARSLLKKYAFKNAGLDNWAELVSEVAGTHLAGRFLKDFFTRPGIPLLRAEYKLNEIKISQVVAVEGRRTLDPPFVVPIIASQGPLNSKTHLLINDSEQVFPFANTESVILDPDSKSYAILIYEAEFYARLLRCLQMNNCNYVNNVTIAHILKDFCWAFLNDHLIVANSGPNSLKLWRDLTKQLSTSPMVQGTCACCMDKKLRKSGDVYCKWHWKDHCESIQLIKELQRLV
uniref:Peptidase_M1 domain-containing protein n=1 Tax=Syphacia muris TaxID=451379 RepID=A0A0N5AXX1_9BILA